MGRKGVQRWLSRNIGRTVILTCQDGFDFRGRLVEVGADGAVLSDASFQLASARHEGMKALDGEIGVPAGTVHFVQVV